MEPCLVICDCHSVDHQLIFQFDTEDDRALVYIDVHLTKRPFFSRVGYGLKYIFGYQSRYGAFDEFIIGSKDVKKFEKIVEYLKGVVCV